MTTATVTPKSSSYKHQFCCCGTVHIVSGAAFLASLTMVLAMFLFFEETKIDSYKIVLYGSFIIPSALVMLATAYEEPAFLLPAMSVDIFYCFMFLVSIFKTDSLISYQEIVTRKFRIHNYEDAVFVTRMSIILFLAITIWKLSVYNRCADYLDANRKEKNATKAKTYSSKSSQHSPQVYSLIV